MKKFGFRIAGVVAVAVGMLALGSMGSAQTQDTQSVSTAVTVNNALEITAGAPLSLTLGTPDSSTTLSYTTNDGSTYSVNVSALTWTFTPTVLNNLANGYPTLAVSAVTDSNENTTATGSLISASNAAAPAVSLVSGIANEAGTVTVTLLASGDIVSLTAGSYTTTLTYTLE